MHSSAYNNAENFFRKYCKDGIEKKTILDVGSYDVNGTLKPIFQQGIYTGLDMEKGPNVDIVAPSSNVPFDNNYFDIVISSSCFEHDDFFWLTFLEMCRVVKSDGLIYVNAPSAGPYHGYPGDNWRFYKDSWNSLNKWGIKNNYEIELIETYIDESSIWKDSIGIFKKK
jgi:SAM-dependent methyltransferase